MRKPSKYWVDLFLRLVFLRRALFRSWRSVERVERTVLLAAVVVGRKCGGGFCGSYEILRRRFEVLACCSGIDVFLLCLLQLFFALGHLLLAEPLLQRLSPYPAKTSGSLTQIWWAGAVDGWEVAVVPVTSQSKLGIPGGLTARA